MKRAIVMMLLVAGGCAGESRDAPACEPAPWSIDLPRDATTLSVVGTSPRLLAEVIAAAQAHCDRPIAGVLVLADHSLDGVHDGQSRVQGVGCPLDAWAMDKHNGLLAPQEPIAHEIGHWCLQSADEDAVEAWAQVVNADALRALR